MRLLFFTLLLMLTLTESAHAAELRVTPPFGAVYQGDTFILDVQLSAVDDPVNAFEAALAVSPNLSVVDIRTARSVVPLWIEEPTQKGELITFSGVIPGGFEGIFGTAWVGIRPGTLFRVVLRADDVGPASVFFTPGAVAYRNDGEGSTAPLTVLGTSFTVSPSVGVTKVVPPPFDDTPPEAFELEVVDGAAFGERGFLLVFNTQDKQTSVVRYEFAKSDTVRAEQDLSWREVESPLPLSDADLRSVLYIRALDEAGNTRVATLLPSNQATKAGIEWAWVIVLVATLILLSVFLKRRSIL